LIFAIRTDLSGYEDTESLRTAPIGTP